MKKTKNNKKLIEKLILNKTYEPIEAIKILKENHMLNLMKLWKLLLI